MRQPCRPVDRSARRAMTLIELMLALSITAMVSLAITSMLNAMSTGVMTKRDCREIMVRAYTAENRLTSYLTPARCILAVDGPNLAVWFDDSHPSETVNVTEIRWLLYDEDAQALEVSFVRFPNAMTDLAKDLADLEYASNTDWWALLDTYESLGYVRTLRLIDELRAIVVTPDNVSAAGIEQLGFDLTFSFGAGTTTIHAGMAILDHAVPAT